jgi:oligosaccharide repeat unit polymerase
VVSSAHELYEGIDNSYRQRFLFIVTGIVLAVIVATFSFRSRLKAGYPIAFLLLYTHYRIYKFEIKQVGIIAALGVIGIGGFSFVEHIIGSGGTSIQLLVNGFIYRVRFEPLIAVINAVPVEQSLQFGTSLFYGGMWLDSGIMGLGNQIELIVTGTNTSGLTIGGTVIAELYLNYGIIGVIIFAPIYGLLLKSIRSALIESNNDLAQGLYPAILFIMLAIVPTSIGWVFRNFVIVILPPIILSLFARQLLSAVSNQG